MHYCLLHFLAAANRQLGLRIKKNVRGFFSTWLLVLLASTVSAQGTPIIIPELAEFSFCTFCPGPGPSVITFSSTDLPDGASLDPLSSRFVWTPTEAQGPGTYPFTVIGTLVRDGSTVTLKYVINVTEVNAAPVLAPIPSPVTIPALVPYHFTASASDPDIPRQPLTFSVSGQPVGASIDPGSGVFSWTPTAAQAGQSYSFYVYVSDNGLSAVSQFITLNVLNVSENHPPVLASIPAQSIPELAPTSFTASATDADGDPLTFSLVDPPAGALINAATGVVTWTPTEAQGPGSYSFVVHVSDGQAADEKPVAITVTEVNQAPELAGVPTEVTIPELVLYTFTATATDADVPAQTLTFLLVNGPPGASIHPATGVFSWTPNEAQGPGTYTFYVKVTDTGGDTFDEGHFAFKSVILHVTEANVAPVLSGVPLSAVIPRLAPYTFTATATDADVPAQPLTFSLAGAPLGASIGSTSGVFTWTPSLSQRQAAGQLTASSQLAPSPPSPTSYTFSVKVSDGEATDEEQVTITVVQAPPVITTVAPAAGLVGTQVTITGTGFTGATAVSFNNVPATNSFVVNDTQILARVPVGATSGPIKVTVPATGTATSPPFLVVAFTSFTPTSGPRGTTVIITGDGFTNGATVTFEGTAGPHGGPPVTTPCIVNSLTQITVGVPAGATTGRISVRTAGVTITSAPVFTVNNPRPVITGFTPQQGPIGQGVTISGLNLFEADEVKFDGTPAEDFLVFNINTIVAKVAIGTTTGKITVHTRGGTARSDGNFIITDPIVYHITPLRGPVGRHVSIIGTSLRDAGVVFTGPAGGLVRAYIDSNSDTRIDVTVPEGAVTGPIKVFTFGGQATGPGANAVFEVTNHLISELNPIRIPAAEEATALQAAPTPFRDQTALTFSLTQEEPFLLEVYDLRGARVATLGQGTAQAGQLYRYVVQGRTLAQGIYIARLTTRSKVQTTKLVLVR
ncbi:putative Ig domain-containing protein [Hymenobacter jejuensis]|uniref:T9SS type A sorting domain-containing protein n=1 Tax=Hymenobacter jejuensis TaxID=2502781 RepID=A0A5B7ZW19_9BACT|nr:putative Ig domain-containing protein [Hymenobacter jejuensis]QDA58785.1 T9SS type A sorting domain-containing protein [Hymenobacter jejuensis]